MVKQEQQRIRINKSIRVPQIKVVADDGAFLGVMETYQALKMAQDKGLDLVEVNPKVWPPLCKIMDYGKFKYEEKKKQQAEKKKNKTSETKELFFHPTTEQNDLQRQVDQARKFLVDSHKVRFTVKFRGRELSHPQIGEEKLKWILQELADVTSFNTPISLNSRDMSTILTPKA